MISIWCTRGEAARAAASRPPPMPSAQRGATRLRPTPAACARAAPRRLRCHAAPLPDGHPKRAAPLRRQPRRTPQPTPLTSEGASLDARASQRASGSRRTPREAPGALCKCRRTQWPSRFSASRQSAVPILGLSPHCEKHAVAMGGRCHCSETQTLRIRQSQGVQYDGRRRTLSSESRAAPRDGALRCLGTLACAHVVGQSSGPRGLALADSCAAITHACFHCRARLRLPARLRRRAGARHERKGRHRRWRAGRGAAGHAAQRRRALRGEERAKEPAKDGLFAGMHLENGTNFRVVYRFGRNLVV